jgi:ELWxxDGT repeat protein
VGGLNPSNFVVINNEVLFKGLDANNQTGLWVTNGTAAGTHELSISDAYLGGLNPEGLAAVALLGIGHGAMMPL